MPLISVVIPVYGAEAFLPRCLDSVLAQTFSDWECILVEDGSPDGSGAICDRYAAKDPRFIVIHQKNQGGSIARNNGVLRAKGEYLIFLDNDDALAPQLLENVLRTQQEHPDSVVLWGYTCSKPEWGSRHVDFKRRDRLQAAQLYIESQLLFAWNKLYSLNFLRSIHLSHEDTVYGSDTIFTVSYILAWMKAHPTGDFYQSSQALHYYEAENPNSETAHYSETYAADELALMHHALHWFTQDLPAAPEDLRALAESMLKTLACCCWIEQGHFGPEAAGKLLAEPVAQEVAALARKYRCFSPLVPLIEKHRADRCCRIGQQLMSGNDESYRRSCRIREILARFGMVH